MELINFKNLTKEEMKFKNIVVEKTVKIGNNVKIGANVCLLGETVIQDNVILHSNTVIEDSQIDENVEIKSSFIECSNVGMYSTIGPFAHLRKGSNIGENCRIGNFVEIKNSTIKNGVKISHLTYVGDAEIGEYTNVGCGVVFCNYNGKIKQQTKVGKCVFIGSNVNIIAPVEIGDYAYIAAGSTINKDVKEDEFAIARERQINKLNFANPYKEKLNNDKNNKN